jgi:hypothetical protein
MQGMVGRPRPRLLERRSRISALGDDVAVIHGTIIEGGANHGARGRSGLGGFLGRRFDRGGGGRWLAAGGSAPKWT